MRTKQTSLKSQLVDFLTDNPQCLREIYRFFPNEKESTIRGRLNENINKCFKRITRGVYLASVGDAQALIIEGDAWDKLKDFEDNSIDAIITDHGYPCLNRFVELGTTRKKAKKLSFETKELDETILQDMLRVLKPGGHFFLFLPADSKETFSYNDRVLRIAVDIGFVFNKRFIWDKQVIGLGYTGRCRYEQILFLSKDKCIRPYDNSIADLLSYRRVSPKKRIHETEKPIELIENLVKFCSKEGDVLLDPFAGSLVLAKACLRLNRNAVCMELSMKCIKKAIAFI